MLALKTGVLGTGHPGHKCEMTKEMLMLMLKYERRAWGQAGPRPKLAERGLFILVNNSHIVSILDFFSRIRIFWAQPEYIFTSHGILGTPSDRLTSS